MATRPVKVWLTDEAIKELDKKAREQGFTARSEFLRQHLLRQVEGIHRDQHPVRRAKDHDLSQVPTCSLVNEVYKRVGVQCIEAGVEDRYTVRTAVWKTRKTLEEAKGLGPAKILIVTD